MDKNAIATLSQEERDELLRLIKNDLDMVINHSEPHICEISQSPETPMKAYIRLAKLNVLLNAQEEK